MAVVLYRDGNTHIENGVICEKMIVDPDLFTMAYLDAGWRFTPEKQEPEQPEGEKTDGKEAESSENADETEYDETAYSSEEAQEEAVLTHRRGRRKKEE